MNKRVLVFGAVSAILGAGAVGAATWVVWPSSLRPTSMPTPPRTEASKSILGEVPLVRNSAEARASLGRRVRLRGTASNAKLAAAVQLQHGTEETVIYCPDRPSWPETLQGHILTLEGELSENADHMAKTQDGVVSQGTSGSVFELRSMRVILE